jgi:16S rRNA (guanine966-N2)-methyltransferase
MSALAADIPGASVLDLFAGSGALGLEALSRGAGSAVFVERAGVAVRVLRANIAAVGAEERSRVVAGDALRFVEGLEADAFDLALADPPYGRGLAAALADRFRVTPFARLLVVEHRRGDDLPAMPDARERRYGDTRLTFIPAPE